MSANTVVSNITHLTRFVDHSEGVNKATKEDIGDSHEVHAEKCVGEGFNDPKDFKLRARKSLSL